MDLDWGKLFVIIEEAMLGPIAQREHHLFVSSGFLRLFITAIQRTLIIAADAGKLHRHTLEFNNHEKNVAGGQSKQRIADATNFDAKTIWNDSLTFVSVFEKSLVATGVLNGYSARLEEYRNSDGKRSQFAEKCKRHWKNAAFNVASTKALRFVCYKTLELVNFSIDFGFNDHGVYAEFLEKKMTLLPEAELIAKLIVLREKYNIQICHSISKHFEMDPDDGFLVPALNLDNVVAKVVEGPKGIKNKRKSKPINSKGTTTNINNSTTISIFPPKKSDSVTATVSRIPETNLMSQTVSKKMRFAGKMAEELTTMVMDYSDTNNKLVDNKVKIETLQAEQQELLQKKEAIERRAKELAATVEQNSVFERIGRDFCNEFEVIKNNSKPFANKYSGTLTNVMMKNILLSAQAHEEAVYDTDLEMSANRATNSLDKAVGADMLTNPPKNMPSITIPGELYNSVPVLTSNRAPDADIVEMSIQGGIGHDNIGKNIQDSDDFGLHSPPMDSVMSQDEIQSMLMDSEREESEIVGPECDNSNVMGSEDVLFEDLNL